MAEVAPSYGSYASAAGATVQVIGQIYAAMQAAKMGEYNEAVARANAQAQAYQQEINAAQQERLADIAQQDILISQEAAAFREARIRDQAAQLEGSLVARIGASGLVASGSPLYVLEENARQAEMAVLVSNYQARLEQRALREEVVQHNYAALLSNFAAGERLRVGGQQAEMARYDAGQTASAGILGATGSAIRGGSQFMYNYEQDRARASGTLPRYQ